MIDQLIERARERPHDPFLLYEDSTTDFATTCALAGRGAAWLASLGVAPGQHVLVAVSNRPLFLFYWLSIAWRGAVAVPIAHDAFGDPLRYTARQSDAVLVLTEESEGARLAAALSDMALPVHALAGEAAFAQAVRPFDPLAPVAPSGSRPVAILYTSGTTGLPKGAVIPEASYRAIGRKIVEAIGITREDRILTFLPLHHANPQMYSVMSALTVGCAVAIVPRFSASRFLAQVRHHRATGFTYVGTVLSILAKEIGDRSPTSLRFCVGGGAPKAVWQELAPRLEVTIHELYGMTETGGMVTVNTREHQRFGSVGRVRDDFEVVILDDQDQELREGVGEIAVRPRVAHAMTSGYYKKPEETVAASGNWWFHTGDLGRFDADGFLFFEGRKKELIRRGGEMISPVAIELSALKHAGVADCAAVGVPDAIVDEEIKLCVVARAELAPGEICGFLAERLPRHMVPRYIQFVPEIPKTPTQKVQRFKLGGLPEPVHDMKRASP
ncbi:AMP-binding protein [Pseudorhodoferax sp.]|uniref:AMP-binding protein n=1 Tax=Pseudorhodoferax sp. TaxID=1993553 RepID=UPI002DD6AEA3|nr:AMP-binding protein [Pseudorhodoferax sp.]